MKDLPDNIRRICFEKATEPPFTGKYLYNNQPGHYHCVHCDALLFGVEHQYDSGSGWPSFYEAIGHVVETDDHSLGMSRIEVSCGQCHIHLGHVFPDGPEPTGRRFCINSLVLSFKPWR